MFEKIKNKFIQGFAKSAEEKVKEFARSLDLDEDGRKDLEEQILPLLRKGVQGASALIASADRKKVGEALQLTAEAVKKFQLASEAFASGINKEEAGAAIITLQEVGKDSFEYIVDACTKDESELTK